MNKFTKHITTSLSLLAYLAGAFVIVSCGAPGQGADPGVIDIPIAYAKRKPAYDDDGLPEDFRIDDPTFFSEGGDLYIRNRSSASATERNITFSVTQGRGDVKDVSANFDGTKLVFSLRLEDTTPNDNITPKWNIYEYDISNDILRRVNSAFTAELGNDVAPAYLPDGRIVFSSDRQITSREVLGNEVVPADGFSKPSQFSAARDDGRGMKALVLHVMNPDGLEIRQISFNQSHDLDPVVLPNGRVLFSRWNDMENKNLISLYTIRPDGSDLQKYYGGHLHSHLDSNNDTYHFTKPQVLSDGRVMTLARPLRGTYGGGDLLYLDGENFVNKNRAINSSTSGEGQTKVTPAQVSLDPFSTAGRYISAVPLTDGSNRVMLSKGTCQLSVDDQNADPVVINPLPCAEPYLSDPNAFELPPDYGVWLLNIGNGTERPLISPQPGIIYTDLVVVQPRTEPPIVSDTNKDNALASENVGVIHIRSVYDMGLGRVDANNNSLFNCSFGGVDCTDASMTTMAQMSSPTRSAEDRPARFIRIIKPASIPDDNDEEAARPDPNNEAYGRSRNLGMREIIGYTEIYPDGSAKFKVPANIAFGIEILDKNARRIGPRHRNWLQINPGETLECNGCHDQHTNNTVPVSHGRSDADAVSLNEGAQTDAYIYAGSENPNTMGAYVGLVMGETIAETITREFATKLNPQVNVEFSDTWRSPNGTDPAISLRYENLTTAAPVVAACLETVTTGWSATCRTIINYEEFIEPLWGLTRIDDLGDMDPNNDIDNTCTSCHRPNDVMNNAIIRVPDGQLDLTNSFSDENGRQHESYRELLFNDEIKILNNTATALVDLVTFETRPDPINGGLIDANNDGDPDLFPIFNPVADPTMLPGGAAPGDDANNVTNTVTRTMSENGANASAAFFTKMTTNSGTKDHTGLLTDDELRLISEWLDLGGQYFNNPYHPDAERP